MSKTAGITAAAIALTVSGLGAERASAGDITIELQGLRNESGRVYLALFSPDKGVPFPEEEGMILGGWRLASTKTLAVTYHGLPDGEYAVTAFHDENGNGELDVNVLGIPTEGYGFSNDAAGFMGPPKFDQAAVTVGKNAGSTTLTMRY
ncbi:MAG: DUF2141 domain-containing protein [Rhodobacteraceae bacterium]|nr:DUF2141 domain-containing protein [Paracoccaceae bacterium]MCY4137259.1 DUF2141 domain-containing protein [Paracoccaceae bacterium]